MKSAVTISLVAEARGGPFVFWDDLGAGMAAAAELGFDAVEIFPPSGEAICVAEVKTLLDVNGLKLAAMGSGAGWLKHKLRLTDPDADVRRKAVEFVTGIIQVAGELGAPAIVGSMQGRWGDGVSREQALAWLAAALEQLSLCAERLGVPLLFEPLNRYETNLLTRIGEAATFLASLPTGNVKVLCDLFHMNIEENDLAGSMRLCGDRIGHIHFADSNRHAVGLGHTDLKPIVQVLREVGYSGYLSAEILPLPDSQGAAKQTIKAFRGLIGRQ